MTADPIRLLILAAHPDDAEFHAGGLAALYHQLGRCVKIVSITDGSAGHYYRGHDELVAMRRQEAARAGRVIGSTYETLNFPDGQLQPTLEARHQIIREIREFKPDLVLTHRTCDYHPDHRAIGQLVQDASYLVTVPQLLPEIPALRQSPVFAYMDDIFTRPTRLRADVVMDVTSYVDTITAMLACHESQIFEWLAYEEGTLETVPQVEAERLQWARDWYSKHMKVRVEHFRDDMRRVFGTEAGNKVEFVEVCEISEYGTVPDSNGLRELFPRTGMVELGDDFHSRRLDQQPPSKLAAPHVALGSPSQNGSSKVRPKSTTVN